MYSIYPILLYSTLLLFHIMPYHYHTIRYGSIILCFFFFLLSSPCNDGYGGDGVCIIYGAVVSFWWCCLSTKREGQSLFDAFVCLCLLHRHHSPSSLSLSLSL